MARQPYPFPTFRLEDGRLGAVVQDVFSASIAKLAEEGYPDKASSPMSGTPF